MADNDNTDKLSIRQLKALAASEKQNRAAGCQAEIAAVLNRYHCELRPFPQLTNDGRITAVIVVAALDLED